MRDLISLALLIAAILVAFPVVVFVTEILASLFSRAAPDVVAIPADLSRAQIAVLIPAHDESEALLPTIKSVRSQLKAGDRLVVIADNCSDNTASVARDAGAEVTERNDPTRIGKGYALDWGVEYLTKDPPDLIIVVDADCLLDQQALDRLAAASLSSRRPAQALYLMTSPSKSANDHRVAEFAFRVKNLGRPLGLHHLSLPCQLMGTGMAFPWEVIQKVELASGEIVEDLKLGLDLARAGYPPLFCPAANVSSEFPSTATGTESQRKRWEQGHLTMIARTFPSFFYAAVSKLNFPLLVLTLDMLVPPLVLLGFLVVSVLALSIAGVVLGLSHDPLLVSAATFFAYTGAIAVCWLKFGREILPLEGILMIPVYAFKKAFIYRHIFFGRQRTNWVRTDREGKEKDVK